MLKLLTYLIQQKLATATNLFPSLEDGVRGLPQVTSQPCAGAAQCNACQEICPTRAIHVKPADKQTTIMLDLGACIACGLCVAACPTNTIANDRRTKTATTARNHLVLSSEPVTHTLPPTQESATIFSRSIALRVVSTGCSACDLEIGAAGNPIFDMERFGIHVVASPRFADALLVTGPVPKAMHEPLRRCYNAMADPRLVIAVGTCAITGGVHRLSYTEANGVDAIIPVDVYIPGCPPHPWSIIYGIMLAMKTKP